MAGRAVSNRSNLFPMLWLRLLTNKLQYSPRFLWMWPVCIFFTCPILRKHSPYFQNAKVSVMGSAQLSQVMTTISKYGIEVVNPYLWNSSYQSGILRNMLRCRLKLKINRRRCIRQRDYGTTGLSSQQTQETLLDWDLLWYLVEVRCTVTGSQRRGMGASKALVSSGCSICYNFLMSRTLP